MRVPKQCAPVTRTVSIGKMQPGIAPSDCNAAKRIACAAAVAACAAVCVGSVGTACVECFAGLGASGCIDCL
jgi:hypothetical protein